MPDTILLCCDLDRTVLPNGHAPESEGVRELFARVIHEANIMLAYVSGRSQPLLQDAINEYEIPVPDYAIGDVGTSLYRIEEQKWNALPAWSDAIAKDWSENVPTDIMRLLADVSALRLQEPGKQARHKISYYAPADFEILPLSEILSRHEIPVNLIWSIDEIKNIGLLDVLPASANKLHAIRFLMELTGVPESQTVFAGDSGNDLPVLTSTIPAVLVKNASTKVRQAAADAISANVAQQCFYQAQGDFYGLNGNYAAGILEGLVHYHPHLAEILQKQVS